MEEAQPCQFLRFANLRRTPGRARPLCTPGTALPGQGSPATAGPQLERVFCSSRESGRLRLQRQPGRAAGATTGPAGQLWREPEWCRKQLM